MQKKVENFVRHQAISENSQKGKGLHIFQGLRQDIVEVGMQGGLTPHKIDERGIFYPRQQFVLEKFKIH